MKIEKSRFLSQFFNEFPCSKVSIFSSVQSLSHVRLFMTHGLQHARLPCPSPTPSSVQFGCSVMSDSLRPHGLQHARSPCPSPTPRVYSNLHPLSQWCHPTILYSVVPFSSCLQSLPGSGSLLGPGSFIMSQLFASDGQVLELQDQSFQWIFRTDFLQDGLVGSPCSPRDSQESSPIPQFKSINSLVLSLLYGPNHTSIHGYWKNHSFD